jgi:putative redox protein
MSQINVHWKGDAVFAAQVPSGVEFCMDTHPDYGGTRQGPTPLEAFLASAAACSAIDVLDILKKKKQEVDSYRIEVTWERGPEGVYPRPVTGLKVKHIVAGQEIDPAAVARSVELSDAKYCSVLATMRIAVNVESIWEIETVGTGV